MERTEQRHVQWLRNFKLLSKCWAESYSPENHTLSNTALGSGSKIKHQGLRPEASCAGRQTSDSCTPTLMESKWADSTAASRDLGVEDQQITSTHLIKC